MVFFFFTFIFILATEVVQGGFGIVASSDFRSSVNRKEFVDIYALAERSKLITFTVLTV